MGFTHTHAKLRNCYVLHPNCVVCYEKEGSANWKICPLKNNFRVLPFKVEHWESFISLLPIPQSTGDRSMIYTVVQSLPFIGDVSPRINCVERKNERLIAKKAVSDVLCTDFD